MLGFFNVENCVLKGCGEFFYRYHEERSLSCLFQHVALCTLSLERARSYLCSVNCCRFLTSLRVERYRGRWGLSGCILPQQGAQNRRGPLLGKLPVQYATVEFHCLGYRFRFINRPIYIDQHTLSLVSCLK